MKPKPLPMMPVFPSDWLAQTSGLLLDEQGALWRLLCHQWQDGALPIDPIRLVRLLRVSEAEFDRVWPAIRDWFAPTADGAALINQHLEQHRAGAA